VVTATPLLSFTPAVPIVSRSPQKMPTPSSDTRVSRSWSSR
jgi:hypothetical protein